MKLGFIGQGFIGKNYADDFERRGYFVVRYALDAEFIGNKDKLADCDIVFIAVPTPTTPNGFDRSIVENVIRFTGEGKTVVIKSTLLPGITKDIQDIYTDRTVLFSPEFLCEATAAHDASNPIFNIIGLPYDTDKHKKAAKEVMDILPESEHNFTVSSQAAELFKYAHNIQGFMRVILSNLLSDTAKAVGADWEEIKPIMDNDPMMSPYYNAPIHKDGRGAGGNCFVKDMAAFRGLYEDLCERDKKGLEVLKAMESKNLELLAETNKSQDIVDGVYGKSSIV